MKDSTKKYSFLPTSIKECEERGWNELDVILFTGDAYIDHPSFGIAIIARVLENEGLRVAIIPQPNWRDDLRDFKKLGKPRLFFGVTSGNMDSMMNHYTAFKRIRSNDAYTPGDKAGYRPDYSVSVYSNILKKLYPDVPVIIGGIEASLRRFTHYDYWSDTLKPSVLIDSKADLLVYGMGEKPIQIIARELVKGSSIESLTFIPQTVLKKSKDSIQKEDNSIWLYPMDGSSDNKINFARNFRIIEEESNKYVQKRIIEPYNDELIIVNPPFKPLTSEELDKIYELPFTYLPHPRYKKKAPIPAYEMIKNSIAIHRGCFGGCSFCTISAHQGKFITSRSEKSILKEVRKISGLPGFKGYISDLGGPSANMYKMKGKNLEICYTCTKASCIFPKICKNLNNSHKPLLDLYKQVRESKNVKKVTIGSGIRYDLLDVEKEADLRYIKELLCYHVSGRLKVAPEHVCDEILRLVRKPTFKLFIEFKNIIEKINDQFNLKQELIPYFISSLPACTDYHMTELFNVLKNLNIYPEQVQDFTPTPMTLATAIYYSGFDPYTLLKVNMARSIKDKQKQFNKFFWYKKDKVKK